MSVIRHLPGILVASCFALAATPAFATTSNTFVVTSPASSKDIPGTLTWAIYQANYQGADVNYINFSIPGVTGETEIVLSEPLYVARRMVINAATQSGNPAYTGPPLIRINCNQFASGFTIVPAGSGLPGGGGTTIQGFRITNYSSNAITIFKGADSNVIANNEIGFAPLPVSGTYLKNTTVAPQCRGIGLQSSSNTIRGNTISGVDNAITLAGDMTASPAVLCRNNTIERNFIGTDPTGAKKIGNTSDGIFVAAGAQDNLIGPGNVLSGMASAGIELLDATATGNRIFGNMIGVNANGTTAIGNGELGVLIANGAANNWVGGPYGGSYPGNIISGNTLGGVAIGTAEFPGIDGTNNNHVEGNLIGCDAKETKVLGTQGIGVTVQFKSNGNVLRKNVIVGQTMHGISLAEASNNSLYGNWIGLTDKGVSMANGGFGVYVDASSSNTVQLSAAAAHPGSEQNLFGLNSGGPTGVYGASANNVIDTSSLGSSIPPTSASRLLNISTRLSVQTGDNALIAGFIITGNSPKKVIVRGVGTSLAIPGALADPTLELNTNSGVLSNDNWRSTQEQEIIATGVPPTSDLESAIVATLDPGSYTAVLRGKGNTGGIGLVEVYDLDSSAPSILANISTRGVVQSGDNAMIAGFIVGGGQSDSRLLVRALGPSLGAAGVSNPLADPTLQLINSNGSVVARNDNWHEDATQATKLTTLGMTPTSSLESAIVATLAPGTYSAVVADRNGSSGTGLVEVYNLP